MNGSSVRFRQADLTFVEVEACFDLPPSRRARWRRGHGRSWAYAVGRQTSPVPQRSVARRRAREARGHGAARRYPLRDRRGYATFEHLARVVGQNRSDVYVGVRNFAGFQKFSLHESGQWHHAFVDEDAAEGQGLASRFLDIWERPDNAPAGWTKALAVKVPHGSLSDVSNEPDDDVIWLPEASEGRVAVVGVVVVEVDGGRVQFRARPVAAYRLANGNAVVLMYETEEITDDHRQALTDAVAKIPADKAAEIRAWVKTAEADAPRMGIFGNDADAVRVTWDLRIDNIAATEALPPPED
jgi:hypothetical protein